MASTFEEDLATPSRPKALRQVDLGDGRMTLSQELPVGPFANEELVPVPAEDRTWTTYNFCALWVGMAHNIPSWTLAAGLVAIGMDWKQAILTIALGNCIVLIPMVLNGHAGTKYGIPFPVFARASFGLRGANLPAMIRASVACAWFGIQTWIGGEGFFFLAGKMFGSSWRWRALAVLRSNMMFFPGTLTSTTCAASTIGANSDDRKQNRTRMDVFLKNRLLIDLPLLEGPFSN